MKELLREEIALVLELPATPERVFAALSSEIGNWWSHRFKDDSTVGFEPPFFAPLSITAIRG